MKKHNESRNKPRGGPGKAFRAGMSLIELFDMFLDENSAREWFEGVRWAQGRYCGHCASIKIREIKSGKPMLYWCADCRSYFSVKIGTLHREQKHTIRQLGWKLRRLQPSLQKTALGSRPYHCAEQGRNRSPRQSATAIQQLQPHQRRPRYGLPESSTSVAMTGRV